MKEISRYLQTRAVSGPWRIEGWPGNGFTGAVVIPALAESERLSRTLASLAENPAASLERFLVLVVVNHREDAAAADKEDNRATLARLAQARETFPGMSLAWVDATTAGREMPAKGGGVGLARKIGLDLALTRLDYERRSPLLVCLDADTLVESSYLSAIIAHFEKTTAGGAAIPFRHQPGRSPQEQQAIDRYELFLRHYLLGLKIGRSPYAFHTVGSAMACTAGAYVKSGGMNRRLAGEDFYFLQHLWRTSGVARMTGTTVYPSPRPSHRVPFGTGRSVSRTLAGEPDAITFYRHECFVILGAWLDLFRHGPDIPAPGLMAEARDISPYLAQYLENVQFAETWEGLRRNNPTPARLSAAFHRWFDGLKTMKLVHHLCAHRFPRCEPQEALSGLLRLAGIDAVEEVPAQLELLRRMEEAP